MKLSVGERLVLLSILPLEGNFITLKIVRKTKEDLSFSEEEYKKYQFVQDGDIVRWNNKDEEKEVNLGEKATDIVVDSLKQLNEQKKLKNEHLSLYEKFISNA